MRLLFCASPGSATLNIIYFSGSARSRKWHRSHPKASGIAFSACAAAEECLSLLVWMALVIDWCKMLVRFSLSLYLRADWEIASWRWEEIKIGAELKRSITQPALSAKWRSNIVNVAAADKTAAARRHKLVCTGRWEAHKRNCAILWLSVKHWNELCATDSDRVERYFCNFCNTGAFHMAGVCSYLCCCKTCSHRVVIQFDEWHAKFIHWPGQH